MIFALSIRSLIYSRMKVGKFQSNNNLSALTWVVAKAKEHQCKQRIK